MTWSCFLHESPQPEYYSDRKRYECRCCGELFWNLATAWDHQDRCRQEEHDGGTRMTDNPNAEERWRRAKRSRRRSRPCLDCPVPVGQCSGHWSTVDVGGIRPNNCPSLTEGQETTPQTRTLCTLIVPFYMPNGHTPPVQDWCILCYGLIEAFGGYSVIEQDGSWTDSKGVHVREKSLRFEMLTDMDDDTICQQMHRWARWVKSQWAQQTVLWWAQKVSACYV